MGQTVVHLIFGMGIEYPKNSNELIVDYEIYNSRTRIVRNPVFDALRNERIIAAELYYNLNGIY